MLKKLLNKLKIKYLEVIVPEKININIKIKIYQRFHKYIIIIKKQRYFWEDIVNF